MLPEDGPEVPDKSLIKLNKYSRLEPFDESSSLKQIIESSPLDFQIDFSPL